MAFVVKTAKTLRNHWKKSTFFFCVTAYGVKWLNDRHQDNLLRRKYCAEAKSYGDQKIFLGQRPRRVTVFLNPAASGGKGRKLFDKTAAPILYLAGIEVNVVSTEYEGQIKGFMTVLDTKDTDGVVVAGGNSSLVEAVTGFLRKEDRSFQENIPVGIIPLGKSNRFFNALFGQDLDQVKQIAEAAIAVVRAVTKKVDVMKFDGGEDRIIYAMTGLEAGAYRDAEERKGKYWYFGPLKSRWTYLRTAMKEWPPVLKMAVSYIEANEENTNEEDDRENAQKPRPGWSFVDFLFGRKQKFELQEVARKAELEEKLKAEELTRKHTDVSTVELTVAPTAIVNPLTPLKDLQVTFGPNDPTKLQLIKEGWSRIKRSDLKMGSDDDDSLIVKKIHIDPQEEGQWYNIDGEAFEAMSVDISLLRNKLNFFCPREAVENDGR